jgi:transposase-like protein
MAYLDARPQASLREVSGEVGCSPETVRTWKKQWEASKRPADETIVD